MTPPDTDTELRDKVSAIFVQMRTRALRDAPIYLQHVSSAQSDVMSLIKASNEKTAREARIEAYSAGYRVAKDVYTRKMIPRSQLRAVYKDIALTFQQTTGIKKSIFIDFLNEKADAELQSDTNNEGAK